MTIDEIREIRATVQPTEREYFDAHSVEIVDTLLARVAELGKSLKLVQSHAKRAMDQLPERWNMGFQAGLKQAVPHEQQLIEALAEEKQARLDDNAKLTADNMVVEAENQRLQDEVKQLKCTQCTCPDDSYEPCRGMEKAKQGGINTGRME